MTPVSRPLNTTSHLEKGTPVQSQSTPTKTPPAARGFFAVLRGLLPAKGTRAPCPDALAIRALGPTIRALGLALAPLCAVLLPLAATAPSALAAPPGFGEKGEGAGQFNRPRGVAVDQQTGAVFVVDGENLRVQRWSGAGVFERAWGRGVNAAGGDSCVAGEVCVAGEAGAGAGEFAGFPSGVAVDSSLGGFAQGNVYVMDDGNSRVQEFTSEGVFVLMFGRNVNGVTHGDVCVAAEAAACQAGEEGSEPGGFAGLEGDGIAVDNTGVVYVGDKNRVQRFNAAGELLGAVELPGVGRVTGLAVDSEGDMYVVAGEGLAGVHKYDPAGVPLGERDSGAGAGRTVVALGPAGELFVYDYFQGHVLEYAADGTQVSSILFERTSSGGLAFGNKLGVLYVVQPGEVLMLTPPPPGPVVVEGSERVDGVLPTSALAHALVNPEGAATEYHVDYGLSTAYGQSTPSSAPLAGADEVQSVTLTATGGVFTLSFEGVASSEVPFDASAGEVQAALEALPGLGAGQVVVSGEPGGPWSAQFTGSRAGEDVPELTADASGLTGPEPGAVIATTTAAVSLFEDRAASAALERLLPGTVYHFRFVASDGSHTTFGPDQSFETPPVVSVESESVSEVTGDSVRLEATLNPHGVASEYRFEYGPTSSYGTRVPEPDAQLAAGGEGVLVHVRVQGLTAGTLYHYRVVARSELGVVVAGPDQTFTTQGVPPTALVDGRRWEMVSPPAKHGSALEAMKGEGAAIQAAEDGHAITYVALAPLNGEAPGSRSVENTQLLSLRTGAGSWDTTDISTPHEEPAGVVLGVASEYQAFSPDLSLGVVEPVGATPLTPALMGERKERTPYRRDSSGAFLPLVTEANTPAGVKFAGEEINPGEYNNGTSVQAMTPDASKMILESAQPLVEGVVASGSAANLYEWQAGALTFVSPVPVAPAGVCGGGGPACVQSGVSLGNFNDQVRGAVSDDGSRVVFATHSNQLFVRDVGRGETLQLNVPQGGARPSSGGVEFQVATGDGSRVFFTDEARLTADSKATGSRPDLYMCDIRVVGGVLSCVLSDLTVDANRNESANVQGAVIAIDRSGRYVYFVADGALAPGAVHGACDPNQATGALCNLYVRDVLSGVTSLVAVVSDSDAPDWLAYPNGHNLADVTAGVSPSGRFFVFMSSRPLTGFDNRDAVSGARDVEVFEFDRERGLLSCVSCGRSGERPAGVFESPSVASPLVDRAGVWKGQWLAGSVPGWTGITLNKAVYRSRYLSDSGRLFFDSPVGLVPGDGNGRQDVYEFEPAGVGGCELPSGCVGLMSSGTASEESAFLDASGSGDDVFFLTASRLVPGDVDGALDLYDAHVCSSGVPCASGVVSVPPACSTADSCRAAPAAQPDLFGAPASQLFSGNGNVAPAAVKPRTPTQIRAERLAKALKACHRIKPRKRRLACQKKARRSYGPLHAKGKHARNAKRAGNYRRAGA
jgi:hypothetical protein